MIYQKAQAILNALGCHDAELSIMITDDQEIKKLNKKYRQHNKPTNVLSFPMLDENNMNMVPQLLGDIVISVESADNEAKKYDITLQERFSQLLIHGILHLLGYDHETSDSDADKMETKSMELIKLIEKNPDLSYF